MKSITCALCGTDFLCGAAEKSCWCAELPSLPKSAQDMPAGCYCKACLQKKIAEARLKEQAPHWQENPTLLNVEKVMQLLSAYHRYQVEGMDCLPQTGAGLIVTHHSLATYDGFMLGMKIWQQRQRLVRALGDNLLFTLPLMHQWMRDLGVVPGAAGAASELLDQGELVAVAPGGMRECLRPSDQKYQVRWAKRKGFVKLAIEKQVPVYLTACPKADDIFTVYENPITAAIYKNFKFPVPLFRGIGLTTIPKPIALTQYIEGPFQPPAFSSQSFDSDVDSFHALLTEKMQGLLDKGKS
ncbi:MAG: hypothetical protein HN509_09595 [Halobacteriovoraceae bacterium]|nr:hypothetical protein [Halobacteriovoraceae bacterium]MBT5095913.1 hypothetical protein [Halobacteriovoraceae bacterium]